MERIRENELFFIEYLSVLNYFLGFSNSKDNTDWDAVYSELKSQGLISLSAGKYKQLDLSEQLRAEWQKLVVQNVAFGVQAQQVEKKLLEILDEKNSLCDFERLCSSCILPSESLPHIWRHRSVGKAGTV